MARGKVDLPYGPREPLQEVFIFGSVAHKVESGVREKWCESRSAGSWCIEKREGTVMVMMKMMMMMMVVTIGSPSSMKSIS